MKKNVTVLCVQSLLLSDLVCGKTKDFILPLDKNLWPSICGPNLINPDTIFTCILSKKIFFSHTNNFYNKKI